MASTWPAGASSVGVSRQANSEQTAEAGTLPRPAQDGSAGGEVGGGEADEGRQAAPTSQPSDPSRVLEKLLTARVRLFGTYAIASPAGRTPATAAILAGASAGMPEQPAAAAAQHRHRLKSARPRGCMQSDAATRAACRAARCVRQCLLGVAFLAAAVFFPAEHRHWAPVV